MILSSVDNILTTKRVDPNARFEGHSLLNHAVASRVPLDIRVRMVEDLLKAGAFEIRLILC